MSPFKIFIIPFNFVFTNLKRVLLELRTKKNKFFDSVKILYIFEFTCILTISGTLYFSNFERIDYNNHYNNHETEAVLRVGNYFYNSPLDSTQAIILGYIEPDKLYHLIIDIFLIKLYYTIRT